MISRPVSISFVPLDAAVRMRVAARRLCRQLAAAALWLVTATPALAAAIGMVTDLSGKAWTGDGAQRQPLAILAYLEAGTVVEVDKGAKLAITFYSPAEEQVFSGPARFRIEKQGIGRISGPAPAVQPLGALAADATGKELNQGGRRTQAAVRMRSVAFGASISGMSPDKTAVRSTTPRLAWSAPPDIGKYRLKLSAADGTALLEESVSGNEWHVPADKALAAGKEYVWSLEASLADGSRLAGKAHFNVLDAGVATRLAVEAPNSGAPFSQRLRYALTLEQAGLNDEARLLWRELASERPTELAVQKRAQP